ncbi:MAG: hypothetical protein KKG59_00250, partial [Nanoarchaeota archaeon]|nr:hypothetical protein [Nanoarchaeota archaeon]
VGNIRFSHIYNNIGCYNWQTICTDDDSNTGASETWSFCVDNSDCTYYCEHTCGNDLIETGEECEPADWGVITSCADLDHFQAGVGSLACTNECFWDTTACWPASEAGPLAGPCGNGVIDSGETCDSEDFGPFEYCLDIFGEGSGYTGGSFDCIAPGEDHECHINTCDCEQGTYPIGMNCGDVHYNNIEDPELDTVSCNDDHTPPVEILCPNQNDCVYANEAHVTNPGLGAICIEDGSSIQNANDETIVCDGAVAGAFMNVWCPINFQYLASAAECQYVGPQPCDSGRYGTEPHELVCNGTIASLRQNYEYTFTCFDPDDSIPGPPDDNPIKDTKCCPTLNVTEYEVLPDISRYGFFHNQFVTIH